ncbi:class II aldolase and adducin N-terminal domain-containing protein [Neorhizobium alkalisoli]|uniref:Ribulose-5-phosphate 4-epimerase/fuculose-1-phosphate aldolase n=1 Tax=Neorhizobium alkalisoli TaxID=528178 RepID=A0A561QWW7_9HYPH|nr:class II aldolase and adducin N-terminal domain-containing protein [Neorhizobium alkalisoli]TWF54843.1 ribulose-5-phosphate 4-epimerase/fuculose-1-phosphate aldolase [Neorhizobium alkalisoli]
MNVMATPSPAPDADERQLRIDLAACFRLAARAGWHEAVANHFSAAISADGKRFLVNPRWRHFSLIRASDLLALDADDKETMARPDAPDPSAWSIHSAIHRHVPHARVALHLHPPYATALAGLKDPSIKPIDQNTARYFNRMAIDLSFGGIATEESEGERIAATIGNHSTVMMGNHGVTVVAPTVAEAFDNIYYLERAAQTMILAYSTGQPLSVMSDEIAEQTAAEWDAYAGAAFAHFEEMKRILDREDPSYAE